jgi:hypothetical protein
MPKKEAERPQQLAVKAFSPPQSLAFKADNIFRGPCMRVWRRTGIGITAIAAFAALAACASAKEREDPFALQIQAGRLGVMTNQSQSLLGDAPPLPADESDAATRARIADDLRLAVFDLARLKMRACPEGRLDAALCAEHFAPAWALRADPAPLEWPALGARIDAVSGAVMPVWSALCEKARENAGPDDEICPME